MPARYTYVWEFQVLPENEAQFAHHYGPAGSWAQLFRRGRGYIETRLLRDRAMPGRYVTVDRWENAAAFESFREHFGEAYMALDRRCDKLTVHERSLGAFEEVVPDEES